MTFIRKHIVIDKMLVDFSIKFFYSVAVQGNFFQNNRWINKLKKDNCRVSRKGVVGDKLIARFPFLKVIVSFF